MKLVPYLKRQQKQESESAFLLDSEELTQEQETETEVASPSVEQPRTETVAPTTPTPSSSPPMTAATQTRRISDEIDALLEAFLSGNTTGGMSDAVSERDRDESSSSEEPSEERLFNPSIFELVLDVEQPRALIPTEYLASAPNLPALVLSIEMRAKEGDKVAQRIIDEIESLARNIELYGLIHPINVAPIAPSRYIIRQGERRALAYCFLYNEGKDAYANIPAILRTKSSDEEEITLSQLSENFARNSLPAIRVAQLCDAFVQAAYNELRAQQPYLNEKDLNANAIARAYINMQNYTGAQLTQRTFLEYSRVIRRINPALHQTLSAIAAPWEIVAKLSRLPAENQSEALQYYIEHGVFPTTPKKKETQQWLKKTQAFSRWLERTKKELPGDKGDTTELAQALRTIREQIDALLEQL